MQYFSKTARILLLTIFVPLVLTACGAKKMNFAFVGTAKAEFRSAGDVTGVPWDILTDSDDDVLATLTQDGDEVTLRFGNTALLKNCELKAKNSRLSAEIAEGAICETDIAGVSRTVKISGGEIYIHDNKDIISTSIKVYGSSDRDQFDLNFEGKSAK